MESQNPGKATRLGDMETVGAIARIILFHNLKNIPVTRSRILKYWKENTTPHMSERSCARALSVLRASGILKNPYADVQFKEVNIRGEPRKGLRQLLVIDFMEMLKLYLKYINKDVEKSVSRYPAEIQRFLFMKYYDMRTGELISEMKMGKELLEKFGTAEGKELSPAENWVWNWQSTRVIEYLKAWSGK